MTRFYFHIRDGSVVVPDEVGMELDGLDAARMEARLSAADLARTARAGGHRASAAIIEIADAGGTVLEATPARGYLH